jgi:hypothetical protein
MNIYAENGYKDRNDYLEDLAKEYEIPLNDVKTMADMLGEDEDFDGLVATIEDMADTAEY